MSVGETIRRARERVYEDADYQLELPTDEPPPPTEVPDWLEEILEWISELTSTGLGAFIVYFVVTLVAGLIAYWIGRNLAPYLRRRGKSGTEVRETRTVTTDPALLKRADALAARGDFGEGIHLLLLESLRALADALERPHPISFTSREILATAPLDEDGKRGLECLVGEVEWFHFGGREPGPDDYQRCRSHYAAFVKGTESLR